MPETRVSETRACPLPVPSAASSALRRAEHFVWLTARVLEQRLFAYHFLHGAADPVETALDAYRTDGFGYGHALEPELRGPAGHPLHTARALRVLDAIGRCDARRAERVGRYLTSVSTPDGALPAVLPDALPGTAASPGPAAEHPAGDLLATGPVVGLLHRNQVWHAWLFRATDFCWRRVEALDATRPGEVQAAVAFLDGVPDRPRARAAAERLGRLVRERRLAVLDPDLRASWPLAPGHAPGEHLFPHDFATTPHSVARAWFTDEEMDRSLDFLAGRQQEDGGWPVTRRPWAPGAEREARPMVTIEALCTLRAYGRAIA